MQYKTITIKIPEELWRQIRLAIINGKIKSMKEAVIKSLQLLVKTL